MSKILITGVAGLLGSHFSRYLLDKGYDVCGVDNLSGGYRDFIDERIINKCNFSNIDLLEYNNLENIFQIWKPDYVYHFAAYAAVGLSPFIRNFNYSNNILCSVNLINNCIKYDVTKIIFSSSMDVYGEGNPPFTEEQIPSPLDPYGIAKYAIELDLKNAKEQFGLNYTIIRPHNVIGIYQNIWDRYRNVIGIWILNIIKNKPIFIYGDGLQERAFSDIKYYMEPFEKVMDNKFNNEIFNIGADCNYQLLNIANIVKEIAKKFGYNPEIIHLEPRNEVKIAYSNHDKAKKMLNFIDKTDIYKTIEEMFIWTKNQPNREIKNMKYEIEKNIYSYWK